MKRVGLLCVALLMAHPATAGTIVTWEGAGLVERSAADRFGIPSVPPPPGTPLSWTVSFDPTAASPTMGGGLPPECMQVPVSATFTLGAYSYSTQPGSLGFTHAQLPGSPCTPSGFTQFSLHTMKDPLDGTPWSLETGGVLLIEYFDLLTRDSFPTAPTATFARVFYTPPFGRESWTFSGVSSINAAVVQPTPVPEPGSLSLLALGLAAVYRKARAVRT